jgi:hypothetical protein
MKLVSLRQLPSRFRTFEDSIRDTFLVELNNVVLTGRNIHYPNCLLYTNTILINPYDEQVMSLKKESFYEQNRWDGDFKTESVSIEETPVLFFHYNVDNYYHFLYDTLPYLFYYNELKKTIPTLKLLCTTSHPTKKAHPSFVTEFLEKFELVFADNSIQYARMFVGTSLTHGQHSNEPCSTLAYSVWNQELDSSIQTPKRLYISRRSWVHGKTENMGTNYTTRRTCLNEDAVVALLATYGIEEVFTELLTTKEKIAYFKQAELVVGVVGGGMCNLLFSPTSTKVLCINTPYFLDINTRFLHSMNHTNLVVSNSSYHPAITTKFRIYSRVKVIHTSSPHFGKIGEIEECLNSMYLVSLSSNDIAGFSQDFKFEKIAFHEDELEAIDNGLNSPYSCKLEELEANLKELLRTT